MPTNFNGNKCLQNSNNNKHQQTPTTNAYKLKQQQQNATK